MVKDWRDMVKKNYPTLYAWLVVAVLVAGPLALFLELAEDVWLNEGFTWDATFMLAVHGLSRPWLDTLFMGITQTAGPLIILPLLVTAVILWRHQKHETVFLLVLSYAGAVGLNTLLKALFARPRPIIFPPLSVETSYSFPSGHTMSAVIFYGLLALWFWHSRHYGWAVISGLWVPLVALSRIYLGVHYPSDVLASLAVGSLWLMATLWVYNRQVI